MICEIISNVSEARSELSCGRTSYKVGEGNYKYYGNSMFHL